MKLLESARPGLLRVALVTLLAACSRDEIPPPAPPVPVTVVKVQTRDTPNLVSAVGSVEPVNSVAVTSMIDGQLLTAQVGDGVFVDAGQLLFKLDPRPAEAALRQAEATLARDQAAFDQARSEVTRNAPVAAKGYISADQMEQYRTAMEAAAASLKVDHANIAAAKVTLGYTDIRAPIGGRIGRILIQPGNLVKANDTNPLVVINQIEPIYVNFALPASLLGQLLAAQRDAPMTVSTRVVGVSAPAAGAVAFIDNAVDTTTGTVKLRGLFANHDHMLWPGQLLNVNLTLGHDRNALVLPTRAVQNGPDGNYVFVVGADGRAEQRDVTVARSAGDQSIVSKGVAAGETVVLDGQSRVENNTPLKVVEQKAAAAADGTAPASVP